MSDIDRYRAAERGLFAAAGIEPKEHRLALRRLGVDARVLETGEGEPTLFLSGGPNAAATFSYLVAAVSGLRCLLLDRPGTGLSARLPNTPDATTLGPYLEELTVDVLDALDLDRAHLVGSSLGGFAALRSAAAHADRVGRIVLLGCPAFVPGWTAPSFFKLLRTPVLGSALIALPPTAAAVRMSLRQMGHHTSVRAAKIPPPMLEWIRAWQRDTDTLRNDADMIIRCGTWRRGFDPSLDLTDETFRAVQAPCLIVVGTDDPVGGESVVRGFAHRMPRAEVEVWNNAGHLPWLDDPDRAGASTSSFLRSTEG